MDMAPVGQTAAQSRHRLHLERLIRLPLLSTTMAPVGQASWHLPHLVHFRSLVTISGYWCQDSGLEHHRQRRGQPLRNTVVLMPGPSWILNLCMLKIRPTVAEAFL